MYLERSPEQSGLFSIHKIQIDFQIDLGKFECFSTDNTIVKSTQIYIVGHFLVHPDRMGLFSRSIWITMPWFEIHIYLRDWANPDRSGFGYSVGC